MKCVVCGKEHSLNACPVCAFPKIEVPNGGSVEKVLEMNKTAIQQHRNVFLDSMTVKLMVYHWEEESAGELVLACRENIPIGTGKQLYENTLWLDKKFARVPNSEKIKLRVLISAANTEDQEIEIELPNLNEPELQELGASVSQKLSQNR